MNIDDLNGLEVTILSYQASWILVRTLNQEVRINFKGKEEFKLSKNSVGTFRFSVEDPLLIDYNEPWCEVYINSKPYNPDLLMEGIKTAIELKTGGKRHWLDYFTRECNFSFLNFQHNIREGNGLLMKAPISIAKEVELLCNSLGVQTKTFADGLKIYPKKALTIGSNYVIAEDFKI